MCPVQVDTNGTTGTFVLVNKVQQEEEDKGQEEEDKGQEEEDKGQEEGGIQIQDDGSSWTKIFVIAAVNHQTGFM